MFFRRVYEGGTISIRNGVELYAPVAENEIEERELEARRDRFCSFMAEMIIKYHDKIAPEIDKATAEDKA